MEDYNLIHFKHGNNKGIFRYAVYKNDFVALSEINTGKIDYIKEKGAIDLSFDENDPFDIMAVTVIDDPSYVQEVYDYFVESGNAYFTNGIEGLCVLKFHK